MKRLLIALTLPLTAPLAMAQNCFDGDFGTAIATGGFSFQDWVSPMQPIGFAFPLAGTNYTDIHVSDHGLAFLSNGGVPVPPPSGDPILYTPSTANFAGGSPKVCALYTDVISVPLSQIWIKSSATKCTITWRDMQNYGIATNYFSFQMSLFPSGEVRCVYGPGCTNASMFGGVSAQGIAGISAGGGVALPAAVDLSAGGATGTTTVFEEWAIANAFDLASNTLRFVATPPAGTAGYGYATLGAPANCATVTYNGTHCGVILDPIGLPAIGNSSFRIDVLMSSVAQVPTAFVGFGSASIPAPGIDLASIGMPGCAAYTNLDIGLFMIPLQLPSSRGSFGLAIPNSLSLVNSLLSTQGLGFGNTPLGLVASYGIDLRVGNGY